MDLIGPLPTTSQGHRFIVTLTDYFSKWAEAAPLPNKSANVVARFIYSVSVKIVCISIQFVLARVYKREYMELHLNKLVTVD